MTTFADYIDHGWALCPLRPGTKKPSGKDWNFRDKALTKADGLRAAGLMHAYSGTMALDVDDYARAAEWLQDRGIDLDALFADPTSVQIVSGKQGSGKLLYACPVPAASVKINEGRHTSLEFRCATANGLSMQDVLPPSVHPETGREYAWRYGDALIGDWSSPPPLPQPLLDVWLAQLAPAPADGIAKEEIEPPAPSAGLVELRELLKNHDPNASRDEWIRVGAAIHHETGGSPEGLALWDEWSQGSDKYKGAADLEKDWRGFRSDRPNAVTAGYLRQGAVATADEFDVVTATDLEDDPWAAVEAERKSKFTPVHVADVAKRPPPEWLIREILPASDLVMLYGQPGAGKSYIALDMAFAIATGEMWGGLETKHGPVAWIAAEAAGSLRIRTQAYARQHGMMLENANLWIVDAGLSLMDAEDADALTAALTEMRPALIVVDTLAAASGGANENSGEDMNKVLDSCRRMHRATGATIMLVHHSGKDEGRGARGWSGLKAAMQTELCAIHKDQVRLLTVTKQRDGPEGDTWPVTLIPVPLGDDMEACVVELGSRIKQAFGVTEETAKLRGTPFIVWRSINELAVVAGGGVLLEDVYLRAVDALPADSEGKDRRRYNVRRALESLVEKDYIEITQDMVFLKRAEDE